MIWFVTDKNLSSWKWRCRYVYPWYFDMREHRIKFLPVDIINEIVDRVFDQIEDTQ
jgi:hypothetical protein